MARREIASVHEGIAGWRWRESEMQDWFTVLLPELTHSIPYCCMLIQFK